MMMKKSGWYMTQALVMYGVPLFVYSLQILTLKSWLQGDICKFHNLNKSFTINTSPQISTALE